MASDPDEGSYDVSKDGTQQLKLLTHYALLPPSVTGLSESKSDSLRASCMFLNLSHHRPNCCCVRPESFPHIDAMNLHAVKLTNCVKDRVAGEQLAECVASHLN